MCDGREQRCGQRPMWELALVVGLGAGTLLALADLMAGTGDAPTAAADPPKQSPVEDAPVAEATLPVRLEVHGTTPRHDELREPLDRASEAPPRAWDHPIHGRVLDVNGSPVENLQVVVASHRDPHVATTDEQGAFTWTGPAATLDVRDDAWTCVLGWFAAGDDEPALRVAPSAACSIELVDAGGAPVSGARILAHPMWDVAHVAGAPEPAGAVVPGATLVRTDGDGRAELRRALGFPYRITVQADGHPVAEVSVPDDRSELRFVLTSGRSIRGTVFGTDGRPLPDVRIREMCDDGARSITDRLGRFAVSGLAADRSVELLFAVDGYASRVVTVAVGERDLAPVILEPAQTIRGLVVDEAGGPLADALVRVEERLDAADPLWSSLWPVGRAVLRTQSTAAGEFRIDGLVGGRYRLAVVDPRDPDLVTRLDACVPGPPVPVRLDRERERSVVLEGRVCDAHTGTPVARFSCATMEVNGKGGGGRAGRFDSEDGTFCVHGLSTGEVVVEVVADGYTTRRRRVATPTEGVYRVDVLLERSVRRKLRFAAEDGTPLCSGTVMVWDGDGERVRVRDAVGRWVWSLPLNGTDEMELDGLPAGPARIELREDSGRRYAARVVFGARGNGELRVQMEAVEG